MGYDYEVLYLKGSIIGAAEALFKKRDVLSQLLMLTIVSMELFDKIRTSWVFDPNLQQLLQKLEVNPSTFL